MERMADWCEIISTNALRIRESGAKLESEALRGLQQFSDSVHSICYKAMQALYSGDIKIASNVVEEYKTKVEPHE